MSGPELHQLGAQLGRELLADLPRSPLAPEPLAGAIFDFAESLVQIGTQRVHSIEVSGDPDLGWYDEPVYGEAC